MAEELIHIYIRKTDWQNQTMRLVHRYYEKNICFSRDPNSSSWK